MDFDTWYNNGTNYSELKHGTWDNRTNKKAMCAAYKAGQRDVNEECQRLRKALKYAELCITENRSYYQSNKPKL